MVILVGLRMNDDGVSDVGLPDECGVVFERGWFGLVGGLGVERKFLCVGGEEVDVAVNQQGFGLSGEGEGKCQESTSLHWSMI